MILEKNNFRRCELIHYLFGNAIKLENEDGAIILDATDSSSSNAGDFVNLEDFHREREDGNILLETHNVFYHEDTYPYQTSV